MKKLLSSLILIFLPIVAILAFSTQHFTTFFIVKQQFVWTLLFFAFLFGMPRYLPSKKILISIGFFLSWQAISLFWSPNVGRGFQLFLNELASFLWFLLLFDKLLEAEENSFSSEGGRNSLFLKRMVVGIIFAADLSALVGIYQSFWGWQLGVYRVTGTIGNPNRLGGLLFLVLPISWWFIVQSRRRIHRVFGGLSFVLLFGGIVASRCQSAFFAALLLFLFGGGAIYRTKKSWRRLLISLGVAFISIGGTFFLSSSALLRSFIESFRGRLFIHHLSWELWKEHFWGGVGLGGYATRIFEIQGRWLPHHPSIPWSNLQDPHSQFFQIAVEMGLIGVGFLFLFLFPFLREFWQKREHLSVYFALGIVVATAFYGMSETFLLSIAFLLIFVLWFLAPRWFIEREKRTERIFNNGFGKMLLIFLITLGLLGSSRDFYGDFLFGKALKVSLQGELKKALNFDEEALFWALDPARIFFHRALMEERLKLFDAALEDFKRSFHLLPTPERALAIANLFYKKGQFAKAVFWGKKAIVLHPKYTRAYANVGLFYLEMKKYWFAWRYLRRAKSLRPYDKRILRIWRLLPLDWQKLK